MQIVHAGRLQKCFHYVRSDTGMADLKEAWNWQELRRFIPCGFLFAFTSALLSMAMGMGLSPGLSLVVGKIYLPICAFDAFYWAPLLE